MSGVFTKIALDGNTLVAGSVQDVEPYLEHNKAMRGHAPKFDWGRLVAEIPNILLVKWMNEEGVNVLKMRGPEFQKFIHRKLNDPDYRHLRVDR